MDAVSTILHKKGDKTEGGNYRDISLVSHVGKVLLNMNARRLNNYDGTKGRLQEEQCGFRADRSTSDMTYVVRRLQETGRKTGVSQFASFISKGDSVDRTLLWQVRTRIGVPPQMIAVIRNFMMEEELVSNLMVASVWIGSRRSKDYGKDASYIRFCSIYSSQSY